MAAIKRYISKKSPAVFSHSISNETIISFDLGPLSTDDRVYVFSPNFNYSAESVTFAFTQFQPSYIGEKVSYVPKNYSIASSEYIEEYDEDTGEYYGYEIYTVSAGSYFSISNPSYLEYYLSESAFERDNYNIMGYDEVTYTNHTHAYCVYYADTEVKIGISYDTYTDEYGNEYETSYAYMDSGSAKIVKPSVTHSTSSYSYHASDWDEWRWHLWFDHAWFSNSTTGELFKQWQYCGQYAYLPVVADEIKLDPNSVALSNTKPVAGSSATITVNRTAYTMTYGTLTYNYQYSINNGTTWNTLGSSTNTTYSFNVPKNATTIQVRVQASDGIGITSPNYVTSSSYTVVQASDYAGVSGTVKSITPRVGVSGTVKTNVTVKKGVNGTVK